MSTLLALAHVLMWVVAAEAIWAAVQLAN